MKKKLIIPIIIAIGLLTVAAVTLFYSFYIVEEVQVIDATARFTNATYLGFNVNIDKLSFGSLPADSPAYRNFFVSHSKSYPLHVKIKVEGNLTPYLLLSDKDFILYPNVTEKVGGTVFFPK